MKRVIVGLALLLFAFAVSAQQFGGHRNGGGGVGGRSGGGGGGAGGGSAATPGVATDPGVRGGDAGAGMVIGGLTVAQIQAFNDGANDFGATEAGFAGTENVTDGLGPMMNLDSCGGCHAFPANGGTAPFVNPQVAFNNKMGATNILPSFISANGPVREARFVRNADGTPDGGVHALFTIAGRTDAPGCVLAQPDFAAAVASNNIIFRIPTPTFGLGLIEAIPDGTILANQASPTVQSLRRQMGVRGRANVVVMGNTISGTTNRNGNDGTIARFGWKAQNKSLLLFSAEAYNVEMGISNDIFPTERSEDPACQGTTIPNDGFNLGNFANGPDASAISAADATPAIQKFTNFMRLLAPPTPSTTTPGGAQSISNGKATFTSVGCALCHTPTMRTGQSYIPALSNRDANLYSDLLVHDMGTGLADGVSQGGAGPQDFRSAPLWGLGQRIFFLHDGRTTDLVQAIQAHASNGSEANTVIANYNALSTSAQQDLLNFLRSL